VHVLVKVHLQESSQPGSMAGLTSGNEAARCIHSGSMAVASTRGERRAFSPQGPLAEVKRVGEVRRCSLPAGRKMKRAAARGRGRRGSRGSS
jgi:hypothetical protein